MSTTTKQLDRKRSAEAKAETLRRKQARAAKRGGVVTR